MLRYSTSRVREKERVEGEGERDGEVVEGEDVGGGSGGWRDGGRVNS